MDLSGTWTLSAVDPEQVPAAARGPLAVTVPGHVHGDLRAHGLVPDVDRTGDDEAVRWVDRASWRYARRFEAPPGRYTLVCECLDTFAEIVVDGEVVGAASNQLRPHRFEVELTSGGTHELSIAFRSALEVAEAEQARLGALPYLNAIAPFNFVRKMACSFGWDWGPALPGCGIAGPIRLEAAGPAGIEAVRIDAVRPHFDGRALAVDVDGPGLDAITLSLRFDGDEVARSDGEPLSVVRPRLWWPRSHGDQPLYELTVTARDGDRIAAVRTVRTGLRTVALDTSVDDVGRRFVVIVNGEPVFCRGANWIVGDCLPHRIDDRLGRRLDRATGANMNTLRVWGGATYGTDAFYDACDERGILVWQDFPFACASYPEAEPLRSQIEAEARHAVARLCRHPSLLLWGGCNENVWGAWDWGFRDGEGPGWGHAYYFDLLPKVCAELDPGRPYWPASPWSGDEAIHPNEPEHGNAHVWAPWSGQSHPVFGVRTVRFCSECGFQSPPPLGALRAITDRTFDLDDPAIVRRQRSERADGELRRIAAEIFGEGLSGDLLHHALQIVQARLLQRSAEWLRAGWPASAGFVYWQLDDCWPAAMSWSAVDGDGRPKPLWYATRRFFADRHLAFVPGDGGTQRLVAINDHPAAWHVDTMLRRLRFDGAVVDESPLRTTVPPRAVSTLATDVRSDAPSDELVYATQDGARAFAYFAEDHALRYPEPIMSFRCEGDRVEVDAHAFVRDLVLHVDAVAPDAEASDALLTLLPGETVALRVLGGLSATDLPAVARTANALVRRNGG